VFFANLDNLVASNFIIQFKTIFLQKRRLDELGCHVDTKCYFILLDNKAFGNLGPRQDQILRLLDPILESLSCNAMGCPGANPTIFEFTATAPAL
jgi:hypothetical protein